MYIIASKYHLELLDSNENLYLAFRHVSLLHIQMALRLDK